MGLELAALHGVAASLMLWWITLAALVLGACGAALGWASRHRNRALQKQLARIEDANRIQREREARRVRLRAVLESEVEVKWYLTICNDGPGPARDFTISIDGTPLEQSPMIDPAKLKPAELEVVGGHGTVRIPLRAVSRPDKLQLELTWSDAAGELGLFEADLIR